MLTADGSIPADVVVLGLGVRPNTALAWEAGLPLGDHGGLRTNAQMQVLDHDHVWAGGDCVEVLNLVSGQWRHVRPPGQCARPTPDGDDALPGRWYFCGMRTTVDSAGRVVIPKALRDALGLAAGQALEITEQDGRLEIVPAATPMRLVDEGDGVAAVADADMPVLTASVVRDTLERIRR